VPLAIGLFVLLAYLVATGTAASAIATARAHTGWLPSWLKSAVVFVLPVAQVFLALGKWLSHHLGSYAAAIEAKVSRWFGELAHYQNVVGYWSLYWPIGLYHFAEHAYRHAIPSAINARTKPLAKRIDAVEAQAKAAAGFDHSVPRRIKAVDQTKEVTVIKEVAMPHAGEWSWVHDHFNTLKKVVLGTAAAAVAVPLPLAPALPIPWHGIDKRVKRLSKDLLFWTTATGAALLVARAIGGVTSNCVKKGPIGKVARALCGIPTHLLDDLLALIADFFVLTEICQVLPWLETAAQDIAIPLVDVLVKAGPAICKKGDDISAPLAIPQLYGPDPSLVALTAV